MYAVIFKAVLADLDKEYFQTAEQLKQLAFSKYGCLDFVSVTQGDQEVAISYWDTKTQIMNRKNDPQHKIAQQMGRNSMVQILPCGNL